MYRSAIHGLPEWKIWHRPLYLSQSIIQMVNNVLQSHCYTRPHYQAQYKKCHIMLRGCGFYSGWVKVEGTNPGLFLSIIYYTITYNDWTLLWVDWLQTQIVLRTTEAEYIALYQSRRNVLPFVGLIKLIRAMLGLQWDTPKLLCSIL